MTLETVALMATGALGMLGWFFAWRARGEVIEARHEVEAAEAGEAAAKGVAFDNGARAVTAESLAGSERSRSEALQRELDGERKAKQALIDALAKSGAPVGPIVVESALDQLYPNPNRGGQGSGSGGH